MLVEMSKVYIVGLKARFVQVTDGLQTYGKLHIASLQDAIESGEAPDSVSSMVVFERTLEQRDAMKELASRGSLMLESLQDELVAPYVHKRVEYEREGNTLTPIGELIGRARELIDAHEVQAKHLASVAHGLASEKAMLQRYQPLMEKLTPLVRDTVAGRDVDSMAILFEKRFKDAIGELKSRLEAVTDYHTTFVVGDVEDSDMVAVIIVVDKEYSKTARELLTQEGVSRIMLPGMLETLPFDEALAQMRERLDSIDEELQDARKDIVNYLNKYYAQIKGMILELENRTAQLDIIDHFGETEYTFVVAGFIPSDEVDGLRTFLTDTYAGAVLVDEVTIDPHDYSQVPVQLKNTGRSKWFEAALGIWGTPAYGTMDPTGLLAFFFPFIFGFIVGDMGYGFTIWALCFWARLKFPENKMVLAFANVMAPAGLATILFGAFYWELFGNLGHVFIPGLNQIPIWHISENFSIPFMRTSSSMQMTYLMAALAFGVFQVFLGLVYGIKVAKKGGHSKHAVEKAGILAVLIAGILLVITSIAMPLTATLGPTMAAIVNYALYLVLAVGFVFVLWGGGIMGAVETLEAVSHIASYLRIMAVGLVGALLADAANELAFVTMPNAGGIIIALILHVMNFVIICFSPTIHALRLNFLEFFSNFWEASKVVYRPFARKEG